MADVSGRKIAYYGYTGAIDSSGAGRIAAALNTAVNSDADEVQLCFEFLRRIRFRRNLSLQPYPRPSHQGVAHNTGSVTSIAVAVFVAASERYCSPHGMFMIHPTIMSSKEGSLDSALADDRRTENILRERAAIPEEILTARRFKDVYITPKEAVIYGLVHGVKEFELPKGNQIIQI